MKHRTVLLILLSILLVLPLTAWAKKVVDCSKNSLNAEISKLDPAEPNDLVISGHCVDDVVITDFKYLTLTGKDGASISATVYDDTPGSEGDSTTAVSIRNSTVVLEDLTIFGGAFGIECFTMSNCTLRDVTIPQGYMGVSAQDSSRLYILGSSIVSGTIDTGVGIFGDSYLVMGPDSWNQFDLSSTGPVITGNPGIGLWIQDGSFARLDNVAITHNGWGIFARRNATLKIYNIGGVDLPGVSFNSIGIYMRSDSVAHIGVPITNNSDTGLLIGALSLAQGAGELLSDNGIDLFCGHPTAVSEGFGDCP